MLGSEKPSACKYSAFATANTGAEACKGRAAVGLEATLHCAVLCAQRLRCLLAASLLLARPASREAARQAPGLRPSLLAAGQALRRFAGGLELAAAGEHRQAADGDSASAGGVARHAGRAAHALQHVGNRLCGQGAGRKERAGVRARVRAGSLMETNK